MCTLAPNTRYSRVPSGLPVPVVGTIILTVAFHTSFFIPAAYLDSGYCVRDVLRRARSFFSRPNDPGNSSCIRIMIVTSACFPKLCPLMSNPCKISRIYFHKMKKRKTSHTLTTQQDTAGFNALPIPLIGPREPGYLGTT